jgi:hypothetical protein
MSMRFARTCRVQLHIQPTSEHFTDIRYPLRLAKHAVLINTSIHTESLHWLVQEQIITLDFQQHLALTRSRTYMRLF